MALDGKADRRIGQVNAVIRTGRLSPHRILTGTYHAGTATEAYCVEKSTGKQRRGNRSVCRRLQRLIRDAVFTKRRIHQQIDVCLSQSFQPGYLFGRNGIDFFFIVEGEQSDDAVFLVYPIYVCNHPCAMAFATVLAWLSPCALCVRRRLNRLRR